MLLLLVVQEKTLIGRPDADPQQDIQLLGLGIMPEHCVVVVDGSDIVLIPLDGARYVSRSVWVFPSFLKLFSNHLYNRTDYNWHEMSVCLTALLNFHFSYCYCMPKTNVFWRVTSHSFTLYSRSCDIYCSLVVPRHFSQCSSEIISSCVCCNKNICHLVHCMLWIFYSPSLLLLPCRCYARPGWTDHAAWSEDVFFFAAESVFHHSLTR